MRLFNLTFRFYPRLIALAVSLSLALYLASPVHATQWFTLKKGSQSTLMIDKQSMTDQAPYIKAWVKVEYSTPQKNVESVDRLYNNARALWLFDCNTRKASTIQVFQYEDQELIYAAGIDVKKADFIEPLPESEVEIAQQYVCQRQLNEKRKAEAANKPAKVETPANAKEATAKTAPAANVDTQKANTEKGKQEKTNPQTATKVGDKKANPDKKDAADKNKADKDKAGEKEKDKKPGKADDKHWTYHGDHGPEKWASLSPEFQACGGQQQSPVNLDNTIPAALKPLKRLQKFPIKSISKQPNALILDAGAGNMMVLDQRPYQLKQIAVHVPAEHKVKQKAYAGELQMLHEDKNGHRVMIAVLIEEGAANPALNKIVINLPKNGESSKTMSLRLTPADLMPAKPAYFRYTGSLTAPPCTEGVQWVVMKEAIKATKAQLDSLQNALGGANQRPVQDAQGRIILE